MPDVSRLEVASQPEVTMGGATTQLTPDKATLGLHVIQGIHDGLPTEPVNLRAVLRERLRNVTFVGANGDRGCLGLDFMMAMADHDELMDGIVAQLSGINRISDDVSGRAEAAVA